MLDYNILNILDNRTSNNDVSYYSIMKNNNYKINNNNIINGKYIDSLEFKEKVNDKCIFITLKPGLCLGVEYGRKFMEKYNISKSHSQNNNNINFYK